MPPPRKPFLALSFLIDFFRAYRHFSSYSRKTIENLQFSVHIKMFPKNNFFALPPRTLGSVAQIAHA